MAIVVFLRLTRGGMSETSQTLHNSSNSERASGQLKDNQSIESAGRRIEARRWENGLAYCMEAELKELRSGEVRQLRVENVTCNIEAGTVML
jgi:hypothetical protein